MYDKKLSFKPLDAMNDFYSSAKYQTKMKMVLFLQEAHSKGILLTGNK